MNFLGSGNIWWYVLGIVFVFGPKWGLMDMTVVTGLAILAVLGPRYPRIKKGASIPIFYLIVLLTYSLTIVVANGSMEFYYPLRFGRALITFVASYFLVGSLAISREECVDTAVLRFVYFVLSVHASIIILEYICPTFRDFIYTYYSGFIPPGPAWIRVAGLTISLGYLSVVQSIGLLMYPFVLHAASGRREKRVTTFCAGLLLLSVLLSGRTGLVLVILLFPLAVWWAGRMRSVLAMVKRICVFGALLAVPLWLAFTFVAPPVKEALMATMRHEFDFISSIGSGQLGNASWDALLRNHYFLPDEPMTFLFGNSQAYHGRDVVNPEAVESDVGFVVNWFGLGAIGVTLILGFYGMLAVFAARGIADGHQIGYVLLLVVALVTGAHFVSVTLFTRHGFEIVSILFWGVFLTLSQNRNTRREALVSLSGAEVQQCVE